MDFELYCNLLDELAEAPVDIKVSLQWIDEPLANPSFFAFAREAKERVPGALWLLQTNGDFLTVESARELETLFDAVAINAYTESAFKRLERLELDVQWSSRRSIIQSPGRFGALASGAVDERAVFHINPKFHHDKWVESYAPDLVPKDTPCTKLFEQAAIGFNGDVHLCCRDHLKVSPVGNLKDASLFSIYNGAASAQLRRAMEAGRRDKSPMCRRCEGRSTKPVRPLSPLLYKQSGGMKHRAPSTSDTPPPWGHYDYLGRRRLSQSQSDVVLPGYLPSRYEYIAGLSRSACERLIGILVDAFADDLVAVWVCGSRVVPRAHLEKIDPIVFVDGGGTLVVGQKGDVREYGKNPKLSSDLDLKVFVDAKHPHLGESLERALGEKLEDAVPFIPVSGHVEPRVRILPTVEANARSAFDAYNRDRRQTLEKGPLSLTYTQLAFQRGQVRLPTPDEVMASVVDVALEKPSRGQTHALRALKYDAAFDALNREERWRHAIDGVSGHQLVGALLDHPQLSPRGVRIENGRVAEGSLAVWAARMAGRSVLEL